MLALDVCIVCTNYKHSQVLRGSHKLGRIEHKRVGQQTGADIERVEQIKKVSKTLCKAVASSLASSVLGGPLFSLVVSCFFLLQSIIIVSL